MPYRFYVTHFGCGDLRFNMIYNTKHVERDETLIGIGFTNDCTTHVIIHYVC